MLASQRGIRMHMPGHKGKLPPEWLSSGFDTTELADTDDLFAPQGGIAEAQRLAAEAAGAAHTLCLTGGSTAGNLAMLLYALRPGQQVILPRNAHVSTISGCVLAGAEPVYVWPRMTDTGLSYIAPEDILNTMATHPKARAVLLTRPDFYGLCTPLEDIAQACRATGRRLLVDEAHGAHLNWTQTGVQSASAHAALWVQSAHKTLPVLTGGAWLHAAKGEDPEALRRALRLVHSSSPSFLILQTMDRARDWMDARGAEALALLRERVRAFWQEAEGIPGISNGQNHAPVPVDALRLVVDVSGRGITGFAAMEALRQAGVIAEMADHRRVVLIPSVWDAPEDLPQVVQSLAQLPGGTGEGKALFPPWPATTQTMPLREAALAEQEPVPLHQAVGRIAAVSAGAYPPGIPVIAPGEVVTVEIADMLRGQREAGATFFGLMGEKLPCVAEGAIHAV